jgi:serine/threonine protein kinase
VMIGSTVSHYKILEKIGEGGMGVVYKAYDTKLDRTVALKFLPDHVSSSSGELERFVQEAKAAAGLNHPNICTIHGIEESGAKNYIVMEFVDGQTLQERKSSLSTKQAVDIGIQIAEGLSAAHERGIVHRDIKPENIMIRKDGRVQVMDFGLAKLRGVSRLTKEGSTVGTAGYMSPEQVQGLETDHRSDIFSLGVLLFEMLTGQQPFRGVHETAISYEIVNVDTPPMSSITPDIPPELDAIVLECLEKDPNERTQASGQVALDLKRYKRESSRQRASRITAARPPVPAQGEGLSASTSSGTPSPSWALTGVVAVAALAIGFAVSLLIPRENNPLPVLRTSISMPTGVQYSGGAGGNSSISPDGSMIVFSGVDSAGHSQLWVRNLASEVSSALPGTENPSYPFWSHDSKSIGFFAQGRLRTVSALGGPVMTLADAPFGRGGAWSSNGTIIFAPSILKRNLQGINSGGGQVHPVTGFDSTTGAAPRFPAFLPDGNQFMFALLNTGNNHSDVYVGSLEDGESRKIINDGSNPVYAAGHLLFYRQGILMAQPFDVKTCDVTGSPMSLQGNLNAWPPRAKADFSSSMSGIILHASGSVSASTELVWVDESGAVDPIVGTRESSTPSLSNDGSRIAFDERPPEGGSDIWTYDIQRGVRTRLTFLAPVNAAFGPVWSRDGMYVYYTPELEGVKAALAGKRSDGSGQQEILTRGDPVLTAGYYASDVSPDGRYLLFDISNESSSEIAMLDLSQTESPVQPIRTGIQGAKAHFSPDGQWIVYGVGKGAEARIMVSEFRGRPGTWQVTPAAAEFPLWVGSKIIYWSTSRSTRMVVNVSFPAGSPVFSRPEPLFPRASISGSNIYIYGYSKTRRSYLGLRPVSTGSNNRLSLIVNWPQLVK